jgi:hypothetical protein
MEHIAMSQEQTTAKKQLTVAELKSLQEIHIPINLQGLIKGWKMIFHDAPFKGYQGLMRKVEGVSKKMMTGKASVISMPLGIILRNTSRAAHNSSEGRYLYTSRLVGAAASIAAVAAGTVLGAPLVTALVGTSVAGFIGSWGAYLAAGSVSALTLMTPAYTVGTLVSSTLVGAAVAAFSTVIAAPVNAVIGFRRSRMAAKGYTLSEDQIQAELAEFDRESPTARYERERYHSVVAGLHMLPDTRKREIYEGLKSQFDAAAADQRDVEQPQVQATAATPAAQLKNR